MKLPFIYPFNLKSLSVLVTGMVMITGTLVSCKKLIEIKGNPPTFITKEQQFADSASALAAVAGVYTYSQSDGFGYSDANFTIATGLSADEISTTLNNEYRPPFYNYSLTPVNSGLIALWKYPYKGIYQINDILDGITNNKQLSPTFTRQITGEMKVVRAFYYFNLLNIFGGVPLVTSIEYGSTAKLPRASVDSVYAQIIADLEDAENKLTPDYPSQQRARPNLYVAKALLAKVQLYRGQWQAAFDQADDVIKSNLYSILDVPANEVFLAGSKEAIWQIPAVTSYDATAEGRNFVPYSGSIPDYLVTPFLLDKFEPGDQRLESWIGTTVVNEQPLKYPGKYKNKNADDMPKEDYMILRLGEVLLIRAEAAAHLNQLTLALKDVNTIRTRAGIGNSPADVSSQNSVLNAVMQERQRELCFEWGNRWLDLKRNVTQASSAQTVLSAEKTGYQKDANLFPIPQTERELNHALTQNPGYN